VAAPEFCILLGIAATVAVIDAVGHLPIPNLHPMSQHGGGNFGDSGIEKEAQDLMRKYPGKFPNMCSALDYLWNSTTDAVRRKRIKSTEKKYNCRRHR
jgi:hypothetical protein